MFDLGLKEKVVVITGGSDGLGRATAERFAAEGAHVVICGRRAEHAQKVAQEISPNVLGIGADVTDSDACNALVDQVVSTFGGIDVLVNNAGASAAFGLETLDDQAWEEDFNLKVMSAVRMCRLVVPHMRARGGGAIVNASIAGAKAPNPKQLPTSVTRSAGLNLTKSLAHEYAAENIRVNAVCIGLIKSMQWERRAGDGKVEDIYDGLSARIPMGRVGESEEYADLVAFLCSARASFITGTAVNIDGGMCPVL